MLLRMHRLATGCYLRGPCILQVPVHRGKIYGGKVLHNLKDTLKVTKPAASLYDLYRQSTRVYSFADPAAAVQGCGRV